MFEVIQEQLQNQFLSGGMVLMLFGAFLAVMRRVPSHLLHLLHRRLVTTVDVSDQDEAFYWLQQWFSSHSYSKRCRLLTISTRSGGLESSLYERPPQHKTKPEIFFSPAPGLHLLRFENRWMLLTRDRTEMTAGVGHSERFWRESFTIRTFVRDRDFHRRLVLKAREQSGSPKNEVSIWSADCMEWTVSDRCRSRTIDSVILADGVMEDLIEEVAIFFTSGDWYHDRGIPYRMGYLLHGLPGNGKTSLAIALASHFHRDIYLVNVGTIGDGEFRSLMSSVPVHSILLIEDVDCFFDLRAPAHTNHRGDTVLSYSGFLNAIDGVTGAEGRLLLLTTNHAEKLDAALVRPGRIDRKLALENATTDQARRLFLRFFPPEEALANRFAGTFGSGAFSMADLQGHLLRYRDSPERASSADGAPQLSVAQGGDGG